MPNSDNFPGLPYLSEDELDELDTFLLSDQVSDESMTLEMLDGYLTAIVIGPTTLMPSAWMPGIWGPTTDHVPSFQSREEGERILSLLMRHYNSIIAGLRHDPAYVEPVLNATRYPDDPHEYVEGEAWAHGFMQGIALCRPDWQPLFDDAQGQIWLQPIHLLGADEISDAEEALVEWPRQREALTAQLPASALAIYRYWLPYREAVYQQKLATAVQRTAPKIGRNDPCPCGSGKKFKKCCGLASDLH